MVVSAPPAHTRYTPSSGIWQTVWLEAVPAEYIAGLRIDQASASAVGLTVDTAPNVGGAVAVAVSLKGAQVASAKGKAGQALSIPIPDTARCAPMKK